MFLYDFLTGSKKPLPMVPEIWLLNNALFGKLAQLLLLNSIISKMMGFILGNRLISASLYLTRISKFLNKQADLIFGKFKYKTMNDAFIHRYDNIIYPDNLTENTDDKFIVAPASAYLSIRNINDGFAEFFPNVTVDIKKMLGDTTGDYDNGVLMVFTLKPFHDHTVDFPINCKIKDELREFAKKRFKVDSTDLHMARASKGDPTLQVNHRVVATLESLGFNEKIAMAEIGANVVNSIQQDYNTSLDTHTKGSQKSHFNYGSTVVMVLSTKIKEQTRFVDEIYQNAHNPNGTVQIKRGTVLLYDKDIAPGAYNIADNISMLISKQDNETTETLSRH